MSRPRTLSLLVTVVTSSVVAAGCAEERAKTKVVEVSGTVHSVDRSHRVLVVLAYYARHERDELFAVHVTNETEFLIDGVLSELGDIEVGERVRGSAKMERRKDEQRFTALQIRVERADPRPPAEVDVTSSGTSE